MMIWHIFKKDCRLMWRYAAGLAALHFGLMAALLRTGRFRAAPLANFFQPRVAVPTDWDKTFYALFNVFPILSYLATALLIVAIVQQDAIPGVRQDWLVRPIRRRDLFLAKLLAVLSMVLGPIFAADLSGALLNGFPLGQSMDAALGRSVWLWFSLFLAVFALASLTRNLMETIVAGTALAGVYFLLQTWKSYTLPQAFFIHGQVDWMDRLIGLSIILIGASTLLGLQYSVRNTFTSRLLTAGFVLIFTLVPSVPWQTAFALEERLSSNPAASNAISVSFVSDHETPRDEPVGPRFYDGGDASVMLPIRVTGIPDGATLYGEASTIRVITPDGHDQMNEEPSPWREYQIGIPLLRMDEIRKSDKPFTYALRLPRNVYSRIADQPVRLEMDFYLTLLKLADTQTLAATGGDQRTRGLGWCGTKISEAGGEIQVGCIQTGPTPTCGSAVLEYMLTGAHNPPIEICARPDYSPFGFRYGPDALSRFTETLPFGNPAGVDTYPVKEPMLPESRVKLKMYEAEDHFERQLAIPQIRLREWAAAE
jgi:hypothetical protein